MIRIYTLTLLTTLFTTLVVAQTKRFAAADYSQGIVFVMENEQIVWSHKAPDCNDLWLLPNGNILFTIGNGVLEMSMQNDTLFHYQSTSNIFACQRLKNGNTFVGECQTGRLLEISPNGSIVSELCILPSGTTQADFGFMRNARCLDNGNYLVAHYGSECVKEYNKKGTVVWQLSVPGGPHSITRLPNGNTIIAVADKNNNPRLLEVNKKGETLWQFSNDDTTDRPLRFLGGFQYFSDGRILFTNWTGHVNPVDRIHLLLVDRQKRLHYTLGNHPNIETISSVHTCQIEKGIKAFH